MTQTKEFNNAIQMRQKSHSTPVYSRQKTKKNLFLNKKRVDLLS